MGDIVKKVYVTPNDETKIVCDVCGNTKRFNVTTYDLTKLYRVTCQCGNAFRIAIEKRNTGRVATALPGMYAKVDNNYVSGKMTVENVSFFGIGFKTERLDDIRIDDIIRVKFTLDDQDRSVIAKEVQVKWIYQTFVGGEFCDFTTYAAELDAFLHH